MHIETITEYLNEYDINNIHQNPLGQGYDRGHVP